MALLREFRGLDHPISFGLKQQTPAFVMTSSDSGSRRAHPCRCGVRLGRGRSPFRGIQRRHRATATGSECGGRQAVPLKRCAGFIPCYGWAISKSRTRGRALLNGPQGGSQGRTCCCIARYGGTSCDGFTGIQRRSPWSTVGVSTIGPRASASVDGAGLSDAPDDGCDANDATIRWTEAYWMVAPRLGYETPSFTRGCTRGRGPVPPHSGRPVLPTGTDSGRYCRRTATPPTPRSR